MTSNQEYTHAPSDVVMKQVMLRFLLWYEAYKKSTLIFIKKVQYVNHNFLLLLFNEYEVGSTCIKTALS